MGAAKDRQPVVDDDYEWERRLGFHYLKDSTGKVVAVIRETAHDTYLAKFGDAPQETYTDLEKARVAMSKRFLDELDERLENAKKKAEPKKPEKETKNA